MRKTKIVCTIGPASSSPEVFAEMCRAGLNVARLNFSHGTHEEHQQKFDMIRKVFAATPEAKARGYRENRFSFNVRGGRCESCSGDGILRIEMHFLADIYVPCEVCKGKRYNRETLEVTYKDKSIADVLDMTVEEALTFFEAYPRISRKLQTLYDVGLGYIRLASPPRRSAAARRSASSWRRSCRAPQRAGRSTCSTSRRPACTWRTASGWSACCASFPRAATRC